MASIIMKRGTTSEISNTPISDGQILFETDTKNIYIDEGSNRIEYRATTIDIDNELSTTSENPVQNKVITTNMNDLEDRVEAGFNELNSDLSTVKSTTHAVTINGVSFGHLTEKRNLNTVSITFAGSGAFGTIAANTEYVCASLTNKPASTFTAIALINAGLSNQSDAYAYLQFKTNGTVSITLPNALSSTRTLRFAVTYLVL